LFILQLMKGVNILNYYKTLFIAVFILLTVSISNNNSFGQSYGGVDYSGYQQFDRDQNNDGLRDKVFIGPEATFVYLGTGHNQYNSSRIEFHAGGDYTGYTRCLTDTLGCDGILDIVYNGPGSDFAYQGTGSGTFIKPRWGRPHSTWSR